MGPWLNKKTEKGSHFIKTMTILEGFPISRDFFFVGGSFSGNLIGLIAPEMMPWLSKKNEDQSGGPKTNLEVFGDEVSLQYFPKT